MFENRQNSKSRQGLFLVSSNFGEGYFLKSSNLGKVIFGIALLFSFKQKVP